MVVVMMVAVLASKIHGKEKIVSYVSSYALLLISGLLLDI